MQHFVNWIPNNWYLEHISLLSSHRASKIKDRAIKDEIIDKASEACQRVKNLCFCNITGYFWIYICMKHMFYQFDLWESIYSVFYAICTDSILTTSFEAEMRDSEHHSQKADAAATILTLLLQSCQFIFVGVFRLNYGHLRFKTRESFNI